VNAWAVRRFVESADTVCEPFDNGGQQQHDRDRRQKAPDDRTVPDELIQGVRE
jgi:hypothetical protein